MRLPLSAKAMMNDLVVQYTGKNNGRLCVAFEALKRQGWTSKPVLLRAKRALLGCSFAVQTRKGHAPKTAEWIGFTWWPLDYEPSMDINARGWPYCNFMTVAACAVNPNKRPYSSDTKLHSVVLNQNRSMSSNVPIGSESEPINGKKGNLSVRNQNRLKPSQSPLNAIPAGIPARSTK
jgi:hypothetical protein